MGLAESFSNTEVFWQKRCTVSLKNTGRSNFLNLRNFETEVDMPEKHGIKSLDPQEIYQHDSGFLVDLFPVQSDRGLKKERSILLRLLVTITLNSVVFSHQA